MEFINGDNMVNTRRLIGSIGGLILLGIVSGCGVTAARGTVAMKIDDIVAHVSVGNKEVSVGDRMSLFRNECEKIRPVRSARSQCKLVKLGEGTVIEVFNEHYSAIKFEHTLSYQEGDLVEKVKTKDL